MLQASPTNDRLQPRKRGLSRYEMCSSKSALRVVESDYRPGADVRLKDNPWGGSRQLVSDHTKECGLASCQKLGARFASGIVP
jgi:chromosome condensin MukBEF MukE localization factor